MPGWRIGTRPLAGGEPVVDVPPVIGRNLSRIDTRGFDRIDDLKHSLHLGPAMCSQEEDAAGIDEIMLALPRTAGAGEVLTFDLAL